MREKRTFWKIWIKEDEWKRTNKDEVLMVFMTGKIWKRCWYYSAHKRIAINLYKFDDGQSAQWQQQQQQKHSIIMCIKLIFIWNAYKVKLIKFNKIPSLHLFATYLLSKALTHIHSHSVIYCVDSQVGLKWLKQKMYALPCVHIEVN